MRAWRWGWRRSTRQALLVGAIGILGMGSAMAQAGAGIVSREMRSSLEEKARRTSIESLEALASGVEGMRVATAVESNDRRAQPRLTAGVAIAPTATSTTQMDPNAWAFDDSDEALSADELWAAEQLQLSGRFAAPFQGEHIYPRIGLGSSFFIGQGVDGGLNQFVGQFDLSLYWIDLHVPYSNLIDGERLPTRIRVDMKIPIPVPIDSASRFALMGGATFSDEYPQLIDSVRFQVAWGYGGEVLSFQVRGGYGYRDTFDQSQMKQGFLYGSTLGLNLGPVQPLLEIDGVRFDDLTGQVDFIPGIRFYPLDTPSLRLGIAALFTFTHEPGDSTLKRRRFGTMFQMSYDFL